jgi:RNA polymerase sigma-70 factor (ECF subfamily)
MSKDSAMAQPTRELRSFSQEETDLVRRCGLNERAAQKELYEKYKDFMFTVSYRLLNDRDLAADVLQESFVEVFKSISQFRAKSTLGTWIKTITIRTALRNLRNKSNFRDIEEVAAVPAGTDNYSELSAEELETLILSMPPALRSVFLLIEVEGYKHDEVAEMLGITPNTSKTELYHAKKLLRKKINLLINK